MPVPDNRPYLCTTCGKAYGRKSHLSRHRADHEDARRYECHGCKKTFSRSDAWRKHCRRCLQREDGERLPHVARGRKLAACGHCARSKVTCDKAQPCGRCWNRRLTCSYSRLGQGTSMPEHPLLSPLPSMMEGGASPSQSGAAFFLQLANPRAASMLDSFTDDDPCDIYDFMAISASGMTVEQELLFLRNLDEFTTEPVAEERHNPDLGHGGNPTSAMFSAEAPITLKAKTDCIERDLQQLHQSLAAFDVTYCEEFDKDTSKEVLAPESIIRFAATYFRLSHHHVPIVHRPSFGSNQTAATLILAVILAGALRSPPRDDALCVRSMARLFEEYIFLRLANIMSVHGASHPDIMSSELLETMQAAVLVYNIQFMDNNATTRRRIRTQRLPTLVATVRQLGLFAIRHSMNMEWGQYVQEQSCIRIAHWTAMADWHQSIMFHMPPLVAVSEMTGDMPDALDTWDSDGFPMCQLEAVRHRHREATNLHPLRSVSDCIRVLVQHRIESPDLSALRRLSMTNLYLIAAGLSCMVVSGSIMSTISESAPAIKRAMSRWQDVWSLSVRSIYERDLMKCGIERYSDGQIWVAQKMLESLVSSQEAHPFFTRVGHDSLVEFHGLLLEGKGRDKE